MSSGPYEIVNFEPKLTDAVLDLQRQLWNPSLSVNGAYLDWKYRRNPYTDRPHIYVVLFNGTVVGMRGLFGTRWEFGTPTAARTILCAGDLIIAPAHRGVGLFTKIMEHALVDLASTDLPYLFNLTAGAATRLGSLSMGWETVGPISGMRRSTRSTRWQRLLRRLRPEPANVTDGKGRPFDRLDRFLRRGGGRIQRGVYVSDAPRSPEMTALIARLGHDGRLRHVRDETYFDWRFQNPRSTYRFVYLMRRHLEAYLVLQARLPGEAERPVAMVDLEAETEDAAARLVDTTLRAGELGPVTVWTPNASMPDRRQALRRLGFEEHRPRSSLAEDVSTILVRPATPQLPKRPWLLGAKDVLNPETWDLRQLYSDSC